MNIKRNPIEVTHVVSKKKKQYVNAETFAKKIGVKKSTVYQAIHRGSAILKTYKVKYTKLKLP